MYNATTWNWTNFTQMLNITSPRDFVLGGALGALLILGLMMAIIFFCAVYVYHALAWSKIAKKMNYKHPWLAWIPFAGSAMRLQLGGFKWGWVFFWIIPPVEIVLLTIATWRIFEKLKHPGWLALSFPLMFFPKLGLLGLVVYFVMIGIIAWKKKR